MVIRFDWALVPESSSLNPFKPTEFEKLFVALPSQYIVMGADDPNFTVIAQNEAHAHNSMVNSKDIIGKPILEAYPDTSPKYLTTGVSDLLESFRKVIKTNKPDTMPLLRYDIRDPQGIFIERYWEVTHYPFVDNKNHVTAIIQATTDVTEEIDSKKELERTSQQLDRALSMANIGSWQWHVPTDKVMGSNNLARMFGIDEQTAAKGIPLNVFTGAIYDDDRPEVIKAIQETLAAKGSFHKEYRTVSTDGSVRWVIARGQVEVDDKGDALNFPGVIIDITDNKQTDLNNAFLARVSSELNRTLNYKKTLSAIANLAVPDIADWCSVEIMDERGNAQQVAIAHKDPAKVEWAKQYRNQNSAATNNDALKRIIKSGKPEFYPEITEAMLSATTQSKADLKLARELALSSAIVVPLKIQDKIVGSLTMILTDNRRSYTEADLEFAIEVANRSSLAMTNANLFESISQELKKNSRLQKALQTSNDELEKRVIDRTQKLEQANQNLQRSNKELEDFAYVASHDLQEPLRKIQAFGNLLHDEYGTNLGEGSDYLDRMRKAAARMSVLIQDLLSFSRVTTHAKPFADVNLQTVLEEVLEDLDNRIEEVKGTITMPKKLPIISADPTQMRQLFQNLIANSLKFHKKNVKPVVQITYTTNGNYLKVSFKDNGVGFDEKYLDRIFAVFQRLHGREEYEGTGIGLAVCRKITERHGGSITAKSAIGKGANFIVTLRVNNRRT